MTATILPILLMIGLGIAAGASVLLARLVRRRLRTEKPADQDEDARDLRTW
ncbi:hypothetical protein HCU64_04005 [Methylobacterium sp. C25]|uniref:hypothetical protein n=1 Tax=Methylobacterium sp. C25 TaxID=2721622 RepID=UPI001F22487A|nr:hypothetical protein [Methylobacterium sp. C25]MCE4222906.1 hypothetical protein [Methylobacterium sp. C25]